MEKWYHQIRVNLFLHQHINISLEKMIKKSFYIILVLFAIISCKKNEESFTLSDDLLTPIISHNGFPEFADTESPWRGNYRLVRTSNEIVATGEKTNATEHSDKIFDKKMYFAKENMKHNFSGSTKIEDWTIINNDEIKIESDAFFFGVSPTYFEVEIIESDYIGYKAIKTLLGDDLEATIDDSYEVLVGTFPVGKIEFLRLTMDYSFLSADESQRSREFREYHFYRLKPTTGGFKFTTLDKYVEE